MRKPLIIAFACVTALLASIFILNSIKPDPSKSPMPPKQKPDNIDSLLALIRKDTHYQIRNVLFDYKDSSLILIIDGNDASTRYFNTIYHVSAFRSIDGMTILNTNNRQLDANSKRGIRLIAAFRDKWCSGNECRPLTARIQQGLINPGNYKPIRLWLNWLGDSSFAVTDSFQLTETPSRPINKKVQAQIDMQGNILAYYSKE